MYTKFQQQAKEYIISSFSQLSDEWWFDIDTSNKDNPIIMGYGPENSMIEAPIEELHHYVTKELIDGIVNLYKISINCAILWTGWILICKLVSDVFRIYRITTENSTSSVTTKNGKNRMHNYIYGYTHPDNNYMYIASPVIDTDFKIYISKEKLVAPLLLLLDPIEYFRQYSVIIKKYPKIQNNNILRIYEALLEYFPEMNEELFEKYLPLQRIFQDKCLDIVGVIGGMLIKLYISEPIE